LDDPDWLTILVKSIENLMNLQAYWEGSQ